MNAEQIRNRTDALVKRVYEASQKAALPENFVLMGDDGVLDSISILELVVALEREFGIEVTGEDVRPENFQDMSSLTVFIANKMSHS
ncbi:MAG: phosphopantetheine-binding protein [Alphaproteobacteria bacterium]